MPKTRTLKFQKRLRKEIKNLTYIKYIIKPNEDKINEFINALDFGIEHLYNNIANN